VIVVLLALVGCRIGEVDSGLVASHVETFEGGDVDAKSCRKIGDAIAKDGDYGATLHEAWRCAVKQLDGGGSEFVDACYVVYNQLESGVIRRLPCASVGRGCPPGARSGRDGAAFLGPVVDPDLVLERARGTQPPFETVRVDVSYQRGEGEQQQDCGYLNVQMPITDDPMARAAELVEGSGWAEPHYSFDYSLANG
jgi:hypothetical protein